MSDEGYNHNLEFTLLITQNGDVRAPGAAVTVALCGHWDHEGACRWPHHSLIQTDGVNHRLTVRFNAPDHELAVVESLIHKAVQSGQLTGPDGRVTQWTVC